MTINFKNNDSPYNGFIKMPVSELAKNQFMDAGVVKIGILNNQEALYNHSFQTRLNVMYREPVFYGPLSDYIPGSPGWTKIETFVFSLSVRKDGLPAGLYGEALIGSLKQDDVSNVALTFETPTRSPAAPGFVVLRDYFSTTSDSMSWTQFAINSGSVCFPASQDPLNFSRYVKFNETSTDGTTFSTDSVGEVMVACSVWVSVPSGSTGAYFQGLILREMPFSIPSTS